MNNEEKLSKLLADRPTLHPRRDGSQRCIGMHSDVLLALGEQLKPGMSTLETGCGLSTLVFALGRCRHKAIVPNQSHIESTMESAKAYDVSLDNVTFLKGRSENILPGLDSLGHVDVILIDGGHAFPIPFIDWFYAGRHLEIGGVMIVDDIDLRSVNILYDFLSSQPEWKSMQIIRRTAFFRRLDVVDHGEEWDYWQQQPFNKDLGKSIRKLWLNIRHR